MLKQNPLYTDAFYHLGVLKLRQGKPDSAIQLWQQTLAIDPNDEDAIHNSYVVLNQNGKSEEARVFLTSHIARVPYDWELQMDYGMLLIRQERFEAAQQVFGRILSVNPSNQQAAQIFYGIRNRLYRPNPAVRR